MSGDEEHFEQVIQEFKEETDLEIERMGSSFEELKEEDETAVEGDLGISQPSSSIDTMATANPNVNVNPNQGAGTNPGNTPATSTTTQGNNPNVGGTTPAPQMPSSVTVDGMNFSLENAADFQNAVKTPAHTMAARANMSAEELESLRKGATRGNKTKFSLIHPNEKSEKAFDETASLMNLIADVKAHSFKCDINGVFNIKTHQLPDHWIVSDGGSLHENCATITEESVAASNLWCAVAPKDPTKASFGQNLEWSHECLCNSMTDELKQECLQQCRRFSQGEQGGPLSFKIMMDILLINTRAAANHLVAPLDKHTLQKEQGESVSSFTNKVQAVTERLKHTKDPCDSETSSAR